LLSTYSISIGYGNVLLATGGANPSDDPVNCILLGANLGSQGGNTIGIGSVLAETGGVTQNTTSIGTTNTVLTRIFGAVSTGIYTVATLPTYSGIDRTGYRAFVTNHRSATSYPVFGEIASATGTFGTFNVPVFFDGTNWRVG
jgi:hypothetical protein